MAETVTVRLIVTLSLRHGGRRHFRLLSAAPELLQRSLHRLFWCLRNDVDGYDNLAIDRLNATLDAQLHRAVANDAMEIASEVLDVLFDYLGTLPQAAFIFPFATSMANASTMVPRELNVTNRRTPSPLSVGSSVISRNWSAGG